MAGRPSRRDVIRIAIGGAMAAAAPRASAGFANRADEPQLIVRGESPLNAETPVELFTSYLTPNDRFFVRSHVGPPGDSGEPRAIKVGGMVKTALQLGSRELLRFDAVTLPAVLQCSGNGRALFAPTIPGVGWERGAVGNAEWTGARLKDILEKAGIDARAKHVHFLGGDGPPNPKSPAFHRSLPIERAMDPTTLVAYGMNGPKIPLLHGSPFRLVVPGWAGNHWMKWLREITVSTEEAPGFYQRTGYKMPKTPVPPGVTPKPEDLVSVTWMNVKSLIAAPALNGELRGGRTTIAGVAWTGQGRVAKVDVAIDDGPWRAAELHGPDHEGAWRMWRLDWDAAPGTHRVRARATDSSGAVQPDATPWNKSGYLWNGIESVSFEVRR